MRYFFILAFSLIVSACTSEPEVPLRVGSNSWPGYEPLYIARDAGFYDDTNIHLVEMPSASEVMHALRSGNLEGAALTLDETLTLVEDNIDLTVVVAMDFSHGGDVLLAKPEINALSELKGKTIALETTAVGAIVLDGALEKGGLAVEDVNLENCSVDKHVQCYNGADAIVTFEPANTEIQKIGGKVLFDSSQIPGRIVDVLVLKDSVIASQPESVRQLVKGYFGARKLLDEKPLETAKTMSPRLGIDPEEILASYNGLKLPDLNENRELLDDSNGTLLPVISKLSSLMLSKGLMKKQLSDTHIITSQFLPE